MFNHTYRKIRCLDFSIDEIMQIELLERSNNFGCGNLLAASVRLFFRSFRLKAHFYFKVSSFFFILPTTILEGAFLILYFTR
jgi:hypothetical protein